jgi:hypothetical protein
MRKHWFQSYATGLQWFCRWYFEPRDIWLGVYWTRGPMDEWDIYICLVPCFPVRIFQGVKF